MSIKYLVWTVIMILLTINQSFGQNLENYIVNEFGTKDGLSSENGNDYLFEDGQGVVWISSQAGSHRFYGQQVIVDSPKENNKPGLQFHSAATSDYFEDIRGDVWFCNETGLVRYAREEDNFYFYRVQTSRGETVDRRYHWLHYDATCDQLLLGANKALYRCSPLDPEYAISLDSINITPTSTGFSTSSGEVGIGLIPTGDPFFCIVKVDSNRAITSLKVDTVFLMNGLEATSFHFFDKEHYLIGTENGILLYNFINRKWLPEIILSDVVIQDFGQRPNGEIIVGSADGRLFRLAGSLLDMSVTRIALKEKDGRPLSFNRLNALFIDSNDICWMSGNGEPVYYFSFKKKKFKEVIKKSIPSGGVKGLANGRNGVWGVTETKAFLQKGSTADFYDLPISGQNAEQTKFIYEDSLGGVWVGTLSWLFYKANGSHDFRKIDLLPKNSNGRLPGYNCVLELEAGVLLFGTNAQYLLRVEYIHGEKEFGRRFNSEWFNQQFSGYITLYRHKDILLATTTGGDVLGGALGTRSFAWTMRQNLGVLGAQFAEVSGSDELYLGSYGGLFAQKILGEIDSLKFERVLTVDRTDAFSLVNGGENQLWLAGEKGLSRYDTRTGIGFRYGLADGAYSGNYSVGASLSVKNGNLLFGAEDGATEIEPYRAISKLPPADPLIVSCEVNGKVHQGYSETLERKTNNFTRVDKLTLTYQERDVKFLLSSGEYSGPGECLFFYELKSKNDEEIIPLDIDPILHFRNLADGSYALSVSATNSDGELIRKSKALSFTILPPWYRTWWAYTLYSLSIAGLAFAFFRIRLQGIRRAEREQLRAAKAEALAAETETSVLRLQMNPHFIFNSLNAVNAYILKGDKLKAHEYLVQFADLIREILNRSARPLTRLDLAIDLLEDYLKAEKMRVGEKLQYTFEVDEELDTFTTYLPTMILQPFVENAIWHGISGLPEGGTITLRFREDLENKQLLVDVEDNGRGRAATGGDAKRHRSMAMDITKRRLEILNQSPAFLSPSSAPAHSASSVTTAAPPKAHYDIEDLKHTNGTAAGTRVTLYLPLDYPQEYESSSD